MASELNLEMGADGYVKVNDLLKLNLKTYANVPLRLHTVDEVQEVSCINFLALLQQSKVKMHYMLLQC